jgi:hypothetical protein
MRELTMYCSAQLFDVVVQSLSESCRNKPLKRPLDLLSAGALATTTINSTKLTGTPLRANPPLTAKAHLMKWKPAQSPIVSGHPVSSTSELPLENHSSLNELAFRRIFFHQSVIIHCQLYF